tara:strand:+ start:782 stop:1117 length:336 start_codon:yes stop_codon:yes gene_type:complete
MFPKLTHPCGWDFFFYPQQSHRLLRKRCLEQPGLTDSLLSIMQILKTESNKYNILLSTSTEEGYSHVMTLAEDLTEAQIRDRFEQFIETGDCYTKAESDYIDRYYKSQFGE